MDVEKICRTCLSLSGPFLSIYDGNSSSGGGAGCLADMLSNFTKTKPRRQDNLPEKVCLSCISEINHCYSFKLKCENSNRTLRQLLPNALPEEPEVVSAPSPKVATASKSVQTTPSTSSQEVQTEAEEKLPDITPEPASEILDEDDDDRTDLYDIAGLDEALGSPAPPKNATENIILHVEKDSLKYDEELLFNQSAEELAEDQPHAKEKEYKFTIYNNANGETEIKPESSTPPASGMSTRKSAAKLLLQQQKQQAEEEEPLLEPLPNKRIVRKRVKEVDEAKDLPRPPKQLKSLNNGDNSAQDADALNLPYRCDRCNAGFALEKSLAIHRRQKSCTNRSFQCDECERVFVSLVHLNEHQASHAAFRCSECGQVCKSKEELGRHMVQGHKRNVRNQCNVCQKVFTMLSTLRDHMRIHTGEKPFSCNICGKSFSQNANLNQHKLRHSDTKRFKCDQCPNSFVTKAELASHARTHTGDKPYECQVCHARFTTSCSLAKHKRKHTGERPYACDLCPMRFTALNVLKNHRRTHTGERPYVCPHCSKTFTQRGDCQMHQRTHQGEKIYICPVCNVEFKSMDEMRTHLAEHEEEDKRLVHFTLLTTKENGVNDEGEEDDDEETLQILYKN